MPWCSVSAVDVGDLDDPYAAVDSLDPDSSALHEFQVASANEPHTKMTHELGEWILDRLPR